MTSIDRMSVERLAEYISPDVRRVMLAQADRIEELEAKLAMAVEALMLAEQLYQVGVLNAPDGLAQAVVTKRHAALAAFEKDQTK
jgi:hypothetical protein